MYDEFFTKLHDYVAANVNLKTYHTMTEDKREKLKTRMTILACKEFAPKKNYGVSRDEVRQFVSDTLDTLYWGAPRGEAD